MWSGDCADPSRASLRAIFVATDSTDRSAKSEELALIGPAERERGQLEQAAAGQRAWLAAIEDGAGDIGGEVGEPGKALGMAIAACDGVCEQKLARAMRLGDERDEPGIGRWGG